MCDGNLLRKMKVKSPMTQLQPSNFNTLLNEIKSTMMSITSVITSPIVTAPSSKLAHQMFQLCLRLFLGKEILR